MKPKFVTVHCSATRPKNEFTVANLRDLHVRQKGWSDIGYHFYITRDGIIHPCRPLSRNGAHVKGHNKDNIGVCLEGGLSDRIGEPENNFTEEQFSALRYLLTEMQSNYGIPDCNVKGHRDWFPDLNGDGVIDRRDWLKECPCFDVARKRKSWSE